MDGESLGREEEERGVRGGEREGRLLSPQSTKAGLVSCFCSAVSSLSAVEEERFG